MMFEDDPRAEEYDKYGRYYPVQTHVDKEAQDKQLKQMNLKSDFFSKHQAYVPYTRKTNDR